MKKLLVLLVILNCNWLIVNYANAQSNSVAASVGRNINIFPVDASDTANIQSEEHISIDKYNPNNLIIAANTYVYSVSAGASYLLSFDFKTF